MIQVSHYMIGATKFETVGAAITHIVYDLASRPTPVYIVFIDEELVPQTKMYLHFSSLDKIIQYEV